MARQAIDLTTIQSNGKKGESAINAFTKINNMTDELYGLVGLGGIAEAGSNANGDYFRFKTGLQICRTPLSGLLINISVNNGAYYRSGAVAGTYPASFIDRPIALTNDPTSSVIWGSVSSTSTTYSVTLYYQSALTDSRSCYVLAVGRWF